MPNGHGGPRPGAGRKSKKTQDYQATMRAMVEEVVTPEDWQQVLLVNLARAKSGDGDSRKFLEPWVMGRVPEEANVNVAGGVKIFLPKPSDAG